MNRRRQIPKGILGFPVAPFTEQGCIDEKALNENINFLVDEGLEAIFIACGSGEFHALSMDEYRQMIDVAIETTKGRVPVYAGVGGNITAALEQARISEEKGVDGYLILPPYLIAGEQKGLIDYLSTIISSTDLNAIVYQRDNAILELKALQKLLGFPQLVGLKDGVGNNEQNILFTQNIGDRLTWLNGMPMAEVTMPAYLPLGFNGYSSAISNYIPHISRLFYTALIEGDKKTVNELHREIILPINKIRNKRKGYAVSLLKAGMEIVGMDVKNKVRPPVIPVEREDYEQLASIIEYAYDKYPRASKQER
ncbi:5-dehydro-4-deoxyglucarate dehydratase [Geomicrobium halophilum]|uniref:Probable 5-dehydro-4-deoxyglucarate dehydratase n=1 Tax=Geomicrobium halophilum TaxID=549000 RepID=A0A841PIG0_9BACL|nr:5-dehydro-4-deoxyglucarate dehydratase [Geomicrobium halophilum]MBB6448667.1 5-dehydro-4-deoxyglucarate dehydratase [Geomicrobium halophilum]